MSVSVAIPPAATVYREEQMFGWWLYAVLAGMVFVGLASMGFRGPHEQIGPARLWSLEVPVVLAIGVVMPIVLLVFVLRMTTEVHPGELRVWFGWVPTYRCAIPLDSVQRLEVVEYRPFRDYGGPGLRRGRDGERVFNARGNRGVRIHLADGTRYLIGSQKPETLAAAIERAMKPVV